MSRWYTGWRVDGHFDINGPNAKNPSIAQAFPKLNMYLASPAGILWRRNMEKLIFDSHEGRPFVIAKGFYAAPKAVEYLRSLP